MYTHQPITRAITLSQSTPPSEFRIFARGANATQKGMFNFDAAAAKSVLAAYARQGVDLPIDLEHLSVSGSSRADALDARGWFKLAVRNGELWAVNVRWTPDGLARLSSKTQRYISPCFLVDKSGRPIQLVNAALVAMPAVYGASALVAASRTAVLSVRATPVTVASVRALAARERTTVTAVLLSALATLASASTAAPTAAQVAALNALVEALGLSKDASREAVLGAIRGL